VANTLNEPEVRILYTDVYRSSHCKNGGGRGAKDIIEFQIGSPDFKLCSVNPNVAKAGGLQSQGVKGEVVVVYRESLTTQDLKFSGFFRVVYATLGLTETRISSSRASLGESMYSKK